MDHPYIYVGPVVRATCSITEEPIFDTKHPKNSCDFSMRTMGCDQKFCYRCGEALEQVQVSVKKIPSIDVWKIADEIGEVLHIVHNDDDESNTHIWLPNRKSPENMREFLYGPYDGIEPLTLSDKIDIEAEKQWITEMFPAAIDILSKSYDEVVVDWGIVRYMM